MRSDFEKDGIRCARELAELFDDTFSLTQRFIAEVNRSEVVDFVPFRREWNVIHQRLLRIVPTADAIGVKKIHVKDSRFWTLATIKTCVPQMKVCVDLQLMALKIAFGCVNEDQVELAFRVFEFMPNQFAPLVLACRDAPKLRRPKDSEVVDKFLKSIQLNFENELHPLYDQAMAIIPLIETGSSGD